MDRKYLYILVCTKDINERGFDDQHLQSYKHRTGIDCCVQYLPLSLGLATSGNRNDLHLTPNTGP